MNQIDKAKKLIEKIDAELKKRKQYNKLSSYNLGEVVHKKQVEFHKRLDKERWVFGGNRSGKTECGAVESIYLARGIHPYRKNKDGIEGWVVSLSTQVQRDVAQDKILSYLNPSWIQDIVMLSGRKDSPKNGIIDKIMIKNVFGGISTIGFKSCDQGREKFQGTSLDFVWFDEEPPEDIYIECKMRVLDRCGIIYATMTPLKGLNWVYNKIYMQNGINGIWCTFMEWADNPFISKDEVNALTQSLSDDELEMRRYGKFVGFGGIVYSEFDENENVIDPFLIPEDWQDMISIDPGLHNPLSAHFYAVDYDGNVYVVAEHYEANKTCEYHANKIKEIANHLNWRKGYNNMLNAIIDSAALQKTLSSEKSVVDIFYENGIQTNPKVNKDLYSGINMVKSYFKSSDGRRKLFIFRNCVNLIREIKSYFWSQYDAPIKKDDHALDELRYYIMSKPENLAPKKNKTLVQIDKQNLYRKLNMARKNG